MLNIELKLIMSMRERPEEWVRVWFPLRPHVADLGHEGRGGAGKNAEGGVIKNDGGKEYKGNEREGDEERGKRRGRALSVFPQVSA